MPLESPLEIEAKFAVRDLDEVRARLKQAGAKHVGRVLETNLFFDTADERLRKSESGLRVRSARPMDGGQSAKATVTFKGPLQAGPFKTRPEYEVGVDDAGRAAELLKNLGFAEFFSFEKRRESWRLGECSVELDELPHLGCFVEIEGPSEAAVAEGRAALGFGEQSVERGSYLGLLIRHCERNGIALRKLSFAGP